MDEGSDWTLGECVFQTLAVVSGQKPMAQLLGCANVVTGERCPQQQPVGMCEKNVAAPGVWAVQ